MVGGLSTDGKGSDRVLALMQQPRSGELGRHHTTMILRWYGITLYYLVSKVSPKVMQGNATLASIWKWPPFGSVTFHVAVVA